MLRTHRAGKGPGGVWGVGLRLKEQKGPRRASGLRGQGTSPGSPAGSPCPSRRGNCPQLLPPGGPLPPASPASLLRPQDQNGTEGSSEGIGPGRELGRLPWPIGQGKRSACSLQIRAPEGPSRRENPSPLSATPQGQQSCLAYTSPPPSVPPRAYRFTWGFLLSPRVLRAPTSIQQVP